MRTADNQRMHSPEHTRDLPGERPTPDLVGLLAGFGEKVAGDPEGSEGALRGVIAESRTLFGLAFVELSATIGASRRVSVVDVPTGRVGLNGCTEEFPVLRGKISIGFSGSTRRVACRLRRSIAKGCGR